MEDVHGYVCISVQEWKMFMAICVHQFRNGRCSWLCVYISSGMEDVHGYMCISVQEWKMFIPRLKDFTKIQQIISVDKL